MILYVEERGGGDGAHNNLPQWLEEGGGGEGGMKEDTLLLPGPRPPFSFRIPSLPIKNRRILKGVRIANMKIYLYIF